MRIFAVVPAYNEAGQIGQVIADLVTQLPAEQIVVVDDGSTDATTATAQRSGVVVLQHPINRGQGAALQTGTDYAVAAGADIIVHFDADGQHQAKEIPEWTAPIEQGKADVVIGSRFLGKQQHLPWSKRLFFRVVIPWHNLFIGLPLTDLHNGTRVLSRSAAQQIRITQDRMAHNSEISSQIAHLGLRYTEVPVEILYHHYGQSIGSSWRIIRDLLKRTLFGS